MQVCLTDITACRHENQEKIKFQILGHHNTRLICGYTERTNTLRFKPSKRYLLSMKGQNTQKDIRGMNLTIVVKVSNLHELGHDKNMIRYKVHWQVRNF